ncbi:unnamed protein product [Closterium sp. NIES-53]
MVVPVLHSFTPVHPCSGSSHVFATTSGPRSRNHFYSRHNRSLRLGEQPRSPPVLYVDNKAMLALCREHRLEHRTKHIALRYFLAREVQQRGQLRLAYVASEANTADIFTKALAPGDHQRFCTLLGLGRPIQFDTWLNDLQQYLMSDSRDSVRLFDYTSGSAHSPPATAYSATRSQWLTRDTAAHLAIRNHLPLAECTHFGQHRTAQALYNSVVAHYSSPASAAVGRLLLPYLFPELSALATVEDLVSHLCTSDARYRAALPVEFLVKNPPPMYITLYFIVTRLPDSLRAVRDHFLALETTALTVDLLEQHLLAAKTSVVGVGAAHGTPRTPFLEGCSPSPLPPPMPLLLLLTSLVLRVSGLLLLVGSAAAARARVAGVVAVAVGVVVVAAVEVVEAVEVVALVGVVAGVGALAEEVVAAVGVAVVTAVGVVVVGLKQLSYECGASGGSGSCPYVIRMGDHASQTCGKPQTQYRCFSRLDDAWCTDFDDEAKLHCWAELLRTQLPIFDLDFDAILAAMYALSVSAEGDYYLCVPRDPGIEAAALGASESALPGKAPAEALHTYIIDSGAFRCFFRDSTTLTPLSARVPVRLANPSGGPVLATSSTVLPCPAVPSGSLSGLHLPSFSTNLVRSHPLAPVASCRTRLSYGTTALVTPPCQAFLACTHASLSLVPRVASCSASSRQERLSPQEMREWFAWRWSRAAGAGGPPVAPCPGGARTGGTGVVGTGGATAAAGVGPAGAAGAGAAGGVGAGVGAAGAPGAAGAGAAGGVGAGVSFAGGTSGAADGAGAAGPAGVGAVGGGTGAVPVGTGGPARPRPYFDPLLEHVLGLPPSPGPAPPLECPQPVQSQLPLQPISPLPAPSPYAGPTGGLAERHEPTSRPASPVRTTRTSRRAPRPRPPAVPGTHQMTLRPSTAPLRVPLPSPPESSLPVLADPASDSLRAASPTAARLLSTVVTDPSFESTAASAQVAELVDFAARCRLDYATCLVAESESVCPPSVGGECALSTDVLEDRHEEFQCFAAASPHLVSTLIAPEGDPDAPDIPTPRSYAEAIEGPYSSQWQSAMDAEMASWKSTGTYVDEVPPPGANIVSGMWIFRVKRPPGSPPVFKARYVARGFMSTSALVFCSPIWRYFVTASVPTSTLGHCWRRIGPAVGFFAAALDTPGDLPCTRPDRAYPLSILARYVAPGRHRPEHMAAAKRVLRYLCSTSGLGLVLGERRPVVLTGHADASWADDQATQRSSQGYTFSLGSGTVSWRSTRSSSVLGSSCEAEIYEGAMAALELRWLTYLLTDLGEPPRSPLVLYIDNKAMLALCREHRLEHIALRYFLARELQQRGQLRLAYVASEANTADIFTKALPPGDHQRFCTMLACFALLDWSCLQPIPHASYQPRTLGAPTYAPRHSGKGRRPVCLLTRLVRGLERLTLL